MQAPRRQSLGGDGLTLLAAALAWLCACVALSAGYAPLPALPLAMALALALPARSPHYRAVHAVAAGGAIAAAALVLHGPTPPSPALVDALGSRVTIVARAAGDADPRPTYTVVVVRVREVTAGGTTRPASGAILVYLPAVSTVPGGVRDGDALLLRGTLVAPAEFARQPGYAAYLERRGIVAALAFPETTLLHRALATPWQRAIRAVREAATRGLNAVLPPREAALAAGLLLGARHALPRDLLADLAASGASHAVSFTAFNVLLVFGAAATLLAPWLGRRRATVAALTLALLYGAVGQGGAAALRGEVMACALTLAVLSGRPYSPLALLTLIAAALCLSDPRLPADPGFQLTFAAAIGVAALAPRLSALLARLTGKNAEETTVLPRGAGGALIVSTAITLATLPLAADVGGAGLWSPLVNAVLFAVLAPLTWLAALVAALGALWPPLAVPAAAPLWLGMRALATLAHLAATAPGGQITIGGGRTFAIAWYTLVAGVALAGPHLAHPLSLSHHVTRRRAPWRRYRRGAAFAALAAVAALGAGPALAATFVPHATTIAWLPGGAVPAALIEGRNGLRVLVTTAQEPLALAQAIETVTGDGRGADLLIAGHAPNTTLDAIARATGCAAVLAVPAGESDDVTGTGFVPVQRLDGEAQLDLGGGDTLVARAGTRGEIVDVRSGSTRLVLVLDGRDLAALAIDGDPPAAALALPPLTGHALREALDALPAHALLLAGRWPDADATIARALWRGERTSVVETGRRVSIARAAGTQQR